MFGYDDTTRKTTVECPECGAQKTVSQTFKPAKGRKRPVFKRCNNCGYVDEDIRLEASDYERHRGKRGNYLPITVPEESE